jgi:hypothetical protein
MSLSSIWAEKRADILKEWKGLLLATYPEDSRRFLSKERDHFANPVGTILFSELERLLDVILKGEETLLEDPLENIIKIRAVQDFKPSEAIGFIFQLKGILRRCAGSSPNSKGSAEFQQMDEVIDRVGLKALDVYWGIKKRLQDLRVAELKRQYERLLIRAKVLVEIPDQGPVTQ